MQSKSSKSLKISILCNLIKVLQLRYLKHLCTLTIKNPEELKKLPVDCAIFICNIYYDEIEEQLRRMGMNNPIERFNDEFMPSFYFDRIDAETREIK